MHRNEKIKHNFHEHLGVPSFLLQKKKFFSSSFLKYHSSTSQVREDFHQLAWACHAAGVGLRGHVTLSSLVI